MTTTNTQAAIGLQDGEAHHMGFTDDRRYLWGGRLDDNKIFVFDLLQVVRIRTGETGADAL